jgi:Lon protease-like protein
MPTVGMFPLGLVLLPGERLPLHIFEPRYQELIGEAIDEGGELGLIFEDDDGVRDTGTLAAVEEVVHRFDDGRLNVVVAGGRPFRVVRWTEGRSFRTAEVELLEDTDAPGEPGAAERGLHLFRRLADQAGAEVEPPERDSPVLSFELAARIDFGQAVKQELLELRSEKERLRRVVKLLERAVQALATEREITDRASRNGKVFAPKE